MTQLTEDQKLFLKSQGVNANEVFDATNLTPKEYSKIMRDEGYKVAYGVTPCSLRTRSFPSLAMREMPDAASSLCPLCPLVRRGRS